jgi:hypothetical protein
MRVPLIISAILLMVWFGSAATTARAGELSGPFANRLSPADVQQIKAAVGSERSISHNIRRIEAVRPDKVAVRTGGRTGVDSATYYDFTLSHRSGKWVIDASSIQTSFENAPNHQRDSDAIAR